MGAAIFQLTAGPILRRPLLTLVHNVIARIPEPSGDPILVSFLPNLHSHRDRLISVDAGMAVHAASDLRKRKLVLDSGLSKTPREFRRILIHEIFHFVWFRLGNTARDSYRQVIASEWRRRAKGELGWSAELVKDAIRNTEPAEPTVRRWKDYTCESFCDTAAWFYSGIGRHPEFTLAPTFRSLRARWFSEYFRGRKLSI